MTCPNCQKEIKDNINFCPYCQTKVNEKSSFTPTDLAAQTTSKSTTPYRGNPKNPVRSITITGMMIAITLLMTYTPLGSIHLPMVTVTIAHLPAIVLAILEGPICGLIGSIALGLISMVYCLTTPTGALDPLIANPLVSVLPRIFIGLAAYFVYRGIFFLLGGTKREGNSGAPTLIATIFGTAAGSAMNTVGVLSMLYCVYHDKLFAMLEAGNTAQGLETPANAVLTTLFGIATMNGISEMILAVVLGTIVLLALKRAGYGKRF